MSAREYFCMCTYAPAHAYVYVTNCFMHWMCFLDTKATRVSKYF